MTSQISYTDPLCDLSKDWNIIIIIITTQLFWMSFSYL